MAQAVLCGSLAHRQQRQPRGNGGMIGLSLWRAGLHTPVAPHPRFSRLKWGLWRNAVAFSLPTSHTQIGTCGWCGISRSSKFPGSQNTSTDRRPVWLTWTGYSSPPLPLPPQRRQSLHPIGFSEHS
jgi:hypothetical protein